MGELLPHPETDDDFHAADPGIDYGPALRVVRERAGMAAGDAAIRFADGSLPVFAVGDRVAKLYPPSCRRAWDNERRVLERVQGTLPIPTPQVQAVGELEGWGFVVMSRLEGAAWRACESTIPEQDATRLASELGEAVACLHSVDPGDLPRPDWPAFLTRQREACVARHERLGSSSEWLERIPPFLEEVCPELPLGGRHALMHTEIMREHVFVARRGARFELTGLLDFEPSRVGPSEYELSSVGLFFSEGNRDLWAAFLTGLGVAARDPELARRCMAWGLIHRYANLRWWLERLPTRSPRRSFDDLAGEWFSGG